MNDELHGEGGGSPGECFWEEHYLTFIRPSNGRPSGALVRIRREARLEGEPARRGRVTVVDPAPEWVERMRLHQVAAADASVKR